MTAPAPFHRSSPFTACRDLGLKGIVFFENGLSLIGSTAWADVVRALWFIAGRTE